MGVDTSDSGERSDDSGAGTCRISGALTITRAASTQREIDALPDPVTIDLSTFGTFTDRFFNQVIAETRGGDPDHVVVVGAHLDSVEAGPGINDDGSGTSLLLTMAQRLARPGHPLKQKIRFGWWGAEEEGLLGSEYYVGQLSDDEVEDIALYLNFDMIASPNYMFGVYDGDDSGNTAPDGFIPEGSAEIEDVFEKFYANRGEPFQDSEFSGRSDYGPFIAVGIPAGGLFTGAEVVKTPAGQPQVNLTGECARIALELGMVRWHLSISHIETHATASAIGLAAKAGDEPGS